MEKQLDWEVHMNRAQQILDEVLEQTEPTGYCDMCGKVECSCDEDYENSLE